MEVWNQEIKFTSKWRSEIKKLSSPVIGGGGVWNQESKFTSKMTTRIYNLDV